jgi:uncharacterized protein (TIGR02271 family)
MPQESAMEQRWDPILDRDGRKAVFASSASDPNRVEVRLVGGERMTVPRSLVEMGADGVHRFSYSFATLLELPEGGELIIPLVGEEVEITKREVARERVQLHTTVKQHTEHVDVALAIEDLTVERVTIGREVDAPTAPRQEGDTFIVPVYEEVLHVEKRLVLREEVHVKRVRREVRLPRKVTLRREDVEVVRSKLNDAAVTREPKVG